MKKASLIMLITAAAALTITVLQTTNAEEAKTVAWYTANIKEAKLKNQQCHDDPSIKDSQECTNALHALEISFGVGH
ncbi:hypothetical protein DOJK_02387 [Patescibacteria group bacterium]|nr:hypothetical protein DOJK_02387 [Patescibacteria group bacterium]